MYPKPRMTPRARLNTITRDSISWKILSTDACVTDLISDKDLQALATTHKIEEQQLRQALQKMRFAFGAKMHLSQPELTDARRKAGQKKLARVNDLNRIAAGKLREAAQLLKELRFPNDIGHFVGPNIAGRRLDEFDAALATLDECSQFFKAMLEEGRVWTSSTPDARTVVDVRREVVCVTLFNLWLDLERKPTFTTDPVSGERTGHLIEFVGDVSLHLTEPPVRLSGEAIKRELSSFKGSD